MGNSDKNTPSNEGLDKVVAFLQKNIKYISAGVLLVLLIFVLVKFAGPSGEEKPGQPDTEMIQGLDTQETEEKEQEETYQVNAYQPVNDLIANYYAAYAAGDIDALAPLVKPISENEKSYIQMFSQYVESYQNLSCYTKKGLEDNSYLVSAYIEVKFLNVDTVGPSLDFFYVRTDENGAVYIDNSYSPYNDKMKEYERNDDIKACVEDFEDDEDVLALRQEVLEKYNAAKASDENLNTVVSALGTAISEWKSTVSLPDEQPQTEEAPSESSETPQETPSENSETPQETPAETQTVYAKERVRVRAEASTESDILGNIEMGAAVTKTGTKDDWTMIDFEGRTGYVKSEFLSESETAGQQPEQNNTTNVSSSFSEGSVITLSGAVNIRASMSETSDKVGTAFEGEKVTVVMSYAEGWTKVNWNGKTGYIKTELLK